MEKRELLYSVERNINWGTENSMVVSQKTGNRTYHMTQQFHSWIYIQKKEKTLIWKDTCTPMLTAAPLPIAKIWKQMCIYTYTQWNTARPLKKNEIFPFAATWMDLEDIMQSDRERQILYDLTYMWNRKNAAN